MKASDLRELSVEELNLKENDLRRDLWKLRFDNHTNQLDDTAKISRLRRDIARIKTVLVERAREQG